MSFPGEKAVGRCMPENAPPNVRGRLSAFAASSRCRIIGACGGRHRPVRRGGMGWRLRWGRKRVTASPVIARGSAWVVGGTACAAAREHAHPAAPSRTAPAAKSASGPHSVAATAVRAIGSTANAHASEIVETLRCRASRQRRERCEEGMLKRGPTHFANASGTKTSAPASCPRSAEHAYGSQCEQPASQGGPPFEACWVCRWARCARDERASHDGRNSRNSATGDARARVAAGDRAPNSLPAAQRNEQRGVRCEREHADGQVASRRLRKADKRAIGPSKCLRTEERGRCRA